MLRKLSGLGRVQGGFFPRYFFLSNHGQRQGPVDFTRPKGLRSRHLSAYVQDSYAGKSILFPPISLVMSVRNWFGSVRSLPLQFLPSLVFIATASRFGSDRVCSSGPDGR